MAAVGSRASLYEERSAGSRRGRRPAGAEMLDDTCGRGRALCEGPLWLWLWLWCSCAGLVPELMVAGEWSCLRERRDGDDEGDGGLGAGDDRGEDKLGRASVGGASIVGASEECCGVWARDDTFDAFAACTATWASAGDLAVARQSRQAESVDGASAARPARPASSSYRAH